jgi:hypothetical protein
LDRLKDQHDQPEQRGCDRAAHDAGKDQLTPPAAPGARATLGILAFD